MRQHRHRHVPQAPIRFSLGRGYAVLYDTAADCETSNRAPGTVIISLDEPGVFGMMLEPDDPQPITLRSRRRYNQRRIVLDDGHVVSAVRSSGTSGTTETVYWDREAGRHRTPPTEARRLVRS